MAIFRKIKTPIPNVSNYVSLLIYVRYRTDAFKMKVRGLYKRFKKIWITPHTPKVIVFINRIKFWKES